MSDGKRETVIEFPCEFPVKVMGARVEGFAQAVAEVVAGHDPEFDAASITMRPSRNGNYLALTCPVWATSQEQLDDLYRELSAHPMVRIVL